ncbi:MAG: MBG domain-containing protein [Erysipelotrichaceae bacterium]|nr:MBG domain-containing protein [Erysipelotrichaceae bacterium]
MNLSTHYKRLDHEVTFYKDKVDLRPINIDKFAYGKWFSTVEPKRDGYIFAGWEFHKASDNSLVNLDQEGTLFKYKMANCDLKAYATWTPKTLNVTVTSYYQNSKGTYDKIKVDNIQTFINGTNPKPADGIYKSGERVIAKDLGNVIEFFDEDGLLIARRFDVAYETDTAIELDEFTDTTDYLDYAFEYQIITTSLELKTIKATDSETSYKWAPNIENIECFYTVPYYKISVDSYASDGLDSPAALSGGDMEYCYGVKAKLNVSVPTGYEFVGWYKEESFGADKKLKDKTEAPLSTSKSFNPDVTKDQKYIAYVQPEKVELNADVKIEGATNLEFGYASNQTAVLKVKAEPNEGSYISAYQWYLKENGVLTPITDNGATTAQYRFPVQMNVGTYEYVCKVTATRTDNGRSIEKESEPFTVTVTPIDIEFNAIPYDGVYDKNEHSIVVNINSSNLTPDDYDIYYSYTEFDQTKLNDKEYIAGSKELIKESNVNVDNLTDNNVVPYTVYFYIKSKTNNYNSMAGSTTITIRPKVLSFELENKATISKTYDGKTDVNDTDLKTIEQKNNYKIGGLIGSDDINNFDLKINSASFDSAEVLKASSVTLKGIILTESDGTRNNNYRFGESNYVEVTISASINPYPLNVTWVPDDGILYYDGTKKMPIGSLNIEDGSVAKTEGVQLELTGAQTNAGDNYLAVATLKSDNTAFKDSNYQLNNGTKNFEIKEQKVTISCVANTVTYDGNPHTLNITKTGLDGYDVTVKTDKSETNAGTYTITPDASSVVIKKNGVDLTENFDVEVVSATLTINKKPISFSGVEVNDKTYDGTANALTYDFSNLTYGAGDIVGDDEVYVNKIEAKFVDKDNKETADAGKWRVDFTNVELGGKDKDNYVLDLAQKSYQTSDPEANILKKQLRVSTNNMITDDKAATYGDAANSVQFGVTYASEDFVAGDDETISLSGITISYQLLRNGETSTFGPTTAKGDYTIVPKISGECTNYELVESTRGTLRVKPKTITVGKADTATVISKVYDGNTSATKLVSDQHYTFTGMVNGDKVEDLGFTFSAAYDTKDCGTGKVVTVTVLGITDTNYVIGNKTFDLDGEITARTVAVKVLESSITYGDAIPSYEVEFYDGSTKLSTTIASGNEKNKNYKIISYGDTLEVNFDCAYDPADETNRNVTADGYAITASVVEKDEYKDNYVFEFTGNKLTVNKKELEVKADHKETIYGTDINDTTRTLTYTYSGFVLGDTSTVISGTPGLSTAGNDDQFKIPDTYPIHVSVGGLSATNYSFKPVNENMVINKKPLTISGVSVDSKTYDGTTDVADEAIQKGGMTYDALARESDKSNKDVIIEAVYDNANCGTGKVVTLNISLNKDSNLDKCYTLTSNTDTVESAIVAKTLTIKAENITINYGDAAPTEFTPVYGEFVKDENSSVLGGVPAFTTVYTEYKDVGEYAINGTKGSITNQNYQYDFVTEKGKVIVAQSKLGTPAIKWEAGVVKWAPVNGIGNVAVSGYDYVLRDSGGNVVASGTVDTEIGKTTDYEIDLLNVIRTKGVGEYEIKVKAVASLTNNEDNKNVVDSTEAVSKTYAVNLTIAYSSDSITTSGGIGVFVKNATDDEYSSSRVVVAGESLIPVKATVKNDTGYGIATWNKGANTNVTVGSTTHTEGSSEYGSTISVKQNLTNVSPINLEVSLNANPAKLQFEIRRDDKEIPKYGYTEDQAPVYTAYPSVVEGDTVSTAGYEYSYKWEYKKNARDSWNFVKEGVGESSFDFPTGNIAANTYVIKCTVTATRLDNNQTITLSKTVTSEVQRGDLNPVAEMVGWTYGNPRNTATYTGLNSEISASEVSFRYKPISSYTWSEEIPTDVGSYHVGMVVEQTPNFNRFETPLTPEPKIFEIAQAKLNTPEFTKTNVTPTNDPRAPFGLFEWKKVDEVKENNGLAGSAGTVNVTYRVTLSYKKASGDEWTEKENKIISGTSFDVSSYCQDSGYYEFVVKAISSDEKNCDHSNETKYPFDLIHAIKIESSDNTASKLYDGQPIKLSVTGIKSDSTVEWYKNGDLLSGANTSEINLTNVSQSGYYVCKEKTAGGKEYISNIVKVTINKRVLTLTSATDSKTYDGTALTNDEVTVAGTNCDGFVDGEGVIYSFDSNSTITNEGSVTNAFSYTENSVTNLDNYSIKKVEGKLTIVAKKLSDTTTISVKPIGNFIYDGKVQTPLPEVTYEPKPGTVITLNNNTDYTLSYKKIDGTANSKNVGTYVVTITGKGNYSESTSVQFDIVQKNVAVETNDVTMTYGNTGSKTENGFKTDPKLFSGDAFTGATYTVYDSIGNVVTDLATAGAGNYTVKVSGLTNDNYNITSVKEGAFIINKAANPIEVTASQNYEPTYKVSDQTHTFIAATLNQGAVTYTVESQKKGTEDVDYFSIPTGTDNKLKMNGTTPVGTYTVTIKAHAAGNSNYNPGDKYITLTVIVAKQKLNVPTLSGSPKTYSGSEQTIDVNGYDSNTMTQTGNAAGTNATTYTVSWALKDTNNYSWNDGTIETKSEDWVINKAANPIEVTASQNYEPTYKVSDQTHTFIAATLNQGAVTYTVESQKKGTEDVDYFSIPTGTDNKLKMNGTTPVGTYTVTIKAHAAGNSNYNPGDKYITLTVIVAKQKLNVPTLSGSPKTYSGSEQTIDVNGYDSNTMTQTGNAAGTNATTYTVSWALKDTNNYSWNDGTIETKSEDWVINKRVLTLTSATDSKTYDGTTLTNNDVAIGGAGFAGTEGVNYNFASTATITDKGTVTNAFTYTAKTGTDLNNYTISKYEGTLTITAKKLTDSDITVDPITDITYDGQVHTPLPVVKYGATPGTLTLAKDTDYTLSYKKIDNTANSKNVGTYVITITGKGNYSESTSVQFDIVPRVVNTVWATDNTWKYDGTEHSTSVTFDNLVSGETCTATLSGNSITNAGTTTVTVTALSNPNYALPTVKPTKVLTVNKRDITFTSKTDSHVYDGNVFKADVVTVGGDGFVSGEGATYSNFATITEKGSKPNTFDYTLNAGTLASNYNVVSVNYGTISVSTYSNAWKVEPSITGHIYGQPDTTSLGSANFGTVKVVYVDKETGGLVYNSTTPPKDAGNYTAKFSVDATVNYTGLSKDIDFTISKKTLQVVGGVSVADKYYDGTTAVSSSQITYDFGASTFVGVEFSDTITFDIVSAYDDANVNIDASGNVIDRTVNITDIVLDAASAKNYVVDLANSINSADSKILKALVTVTADDQTKAFGDSDPTLTYSYTKINGETLTLNIDRDAGETVGTYVINLSQDDGTYPNYQLTLLNGTMTIVKGPYKGETDLYVSLKLGNDSIYDLDKISKTLADDSIVKLPDGYKAEIVGVVDTDNMFKETPTLSGNKVSFGFKNSATITPNEVAQIMIKITSPDVSDFTLTINVIVLLGNSEIDDAIPSGWKLVGSPVLIPGGITTITIVDIATNSIYKTLEVYVLPEIIYDERMVGGESIITDEVYTKTVDSRAIIHCTGDITKFQDVYITYDTDEYVKVDKKDKATGADNYIVKPGSTIITFSKEFMDSLSVGLHYVELVYESGSAFSTILVKEPPVIPSGGSSSSSSAKPVRPWYGSTVETDAGVEVPGEIGGGEDVIVHNPTTSNPTGDPIEIEVIKTWSLINLVVSVAAVVLGVIALFRKRRRLLSITGLINPIIFLLTQNMRYKMVWFDKYTIWMCLILIVELVLIFWKRKDEEEEEEESTEGC